MKVIEYWIEVCTTVTWLLLRRAEQVSRQCGLIDLDRESEIQKFNDFMSQFSRHRRFYRKMFKEETGTYKPPRSCRKWNLTMHEWGFSIAKASCKELHAEKRVTFTSNDSRSGRVQKAEVWRASATSRISVLAFYTLCMSALICTGCRPRRSL
ncbi:hypothetical protein BT96DRAFT_543065 [Gymnopus androsaceus JB14]|uniref:Uncharacterized protein n=1 Tax=Gymnopus androsaceus JB14 TaxID=1447944 RepID=A0A6A4I0Z9_9AGAR|nr:hypothetical protein BT96DRAFT_543065 [Gymnopus androsaceus JB14]